MDNMNMFPLGAGFLFPNGKYYFTEAKGHERLAYDILKNVYDRNILEITDPEYILQAEFSAILLRYRHGERLLYLPNTCEFIPFYSALVEAIQHRKAYLLDYDLKIKLKRGVNFSYLDMLSDVEKIYHISLEQAKEEYYESFEQKEIIPRDEECISIIEILFEAEEMELLANQAEAENDEVKQKTYEIADTDTPMEEEIKQYLNDPEMMIRMLKEKKGI